MPLGKDRLAPSGNVRVMSPMRCSSHSLPTKQVRWKSSREPRNSPRASELVPLRVPPCQDGHACHVVARPAHWADVGGRTQQKRIEAQAGPAAAGAAAITNCFEGARKKAKPFCWLRGASGQHVPGGEPRSDRFE